MFVSDIIQQGLGLPWHKKRKLRLQKILLSIQSQRSSVAATLSGEVTAQCDCWDHVAAGDKRDVLDLQGGGSLWLSGDLCRPHCASILL